MFVVLRIPLGYQETVFKGHRIAIKKNKNTGGKNLLDGYYVNYINILFEG